ncbi:MAG: hypothetical protein QM813_17135 [Verrucomicrobiota bacterium]
MEAVISSLDTTANIRQHLEIESEISLEQAREIPLADMNEAELMVVILHDPGLSERRAALRQLKMSILQDAEVRICEVLWMARK